MPPKIRQLISEDQIRDRIAALASDINDDYADTELRIVAILHGALVFVGDLMRRLTVPVTLDIAKIQSYAGTESTGELTYQLRPTRPLENQHVLLVDDILDTGLTLERVANDLRQAGAMDVKTCVLLDKPERRTRPVQADYVGFTIDNVFVVGYGLDFNEKYRNLPFVGEILE
jgi:hypoxanthine phosphoribosyltransferase